MGEKGNSTGGIEPGKVPGVPRRGSTAATEGSWAKEPSGPPAADWGKAAQEGWGKTPGEDWAKAAGGGQQLGPSAPPPVQRQSGFPAPSPTQGPPQGAPPIGGFVAGRRDRDDDRQPPPPLPPGGSHPPAPGR